MSSSPTGLPIPEGPGSVSGAPNLPEGFTSTFISQCIDTGELRQHVVTGGGGPPLLLVHGRHCCGWTAPGFDQVQAAEEAGRRGAVAHGGFRPAPALV